jgi:hypothetical protein
MINWWPITRSRLEDPKYQALTPRERLYVEYIISRYSHQGPFYQSDLEVAITLSMSVIEVRCTRRKVGAPTDSARKQAARGHSVELKSGLGWIIYVPGWEQGSKRLATQYVDVPIAAVKKGDYFSPAPRYTFEQLLACVRKKQLTHADVTVWLALFYKHEQCRGAKEDHSFFITKLELAQLSGVISATVSVQNLYEKLVFADGTHLFKYSDEHQRLVFSEWASMADPSEDENSARIQKETLREIAAAVAKAKKKLAQKRSASQKSKAVSTEEDAVVTHPDGKIRHLMTLADQQYQDDADWETTDGKNFYVSEAARERTDRQTEMEWKRQQDERDAKRKRQQLEAARKRRAKRVSQTQKPLPGQNSAFDDKIRAHGRVYHVTDPQMSYDHVHIDDSSSWETTDGKNYYLTEAAKNRDAEWRRKFIERQVKYLRLEQEEAARDEQAWASQKGAT